MMGPADQGGAFYTSEGMAMYQIDETNWANPIRPRCRREKNWNVVRRVFQDATRVQKRDVSEIVLYRGGITWRATEICEKEEGREVSMDTWDTYLTKWCQRGYLKRVDKGMYKLGPKGL